MPRTQLTMLPMRSSEYFVTELPMLAHVMPLTDEDAQSSFVRYRARAFNRRACGSSTADKSGYLIRRCPVRAPLAAN